MREVARKARQEFVNEITSMGGTMPYLLLILLGLALGHTGEAAILALGYALTLSIVIGIKIFYFKPRPEPIAYRSFYGKMWASSFPSLHAMRTFMLAMLLGTWSGSWKAHAILLVLASLVAWSRVKLGKHDWVDVTAGGAMGIIVGLALRPL